MKKSKSNIWTYVIIGIIILGVIAYLNLKNNIENGSDITVDDIISETGNVIQNIVVPPSPETLLSAETYNDAVSGVVGNVASYHDNDLMTYAEFSNAGTTAILDSKWMASSNIENATFSMLNAGSTIPPWITERKYNAFFIVPEECIKGKVIQVRIETKTTSILSIPTTAVVKCYNGASYVEFGKLFVFTSNSAFWLYEDQMLINQ